ncbi:CLUMA_CG009538, isoform A [Clunio marinus]|uniref:CLUMA_CG009538, isoform A n=1 Tax=Clunio marinus TaxID=568069 RepID=A0A1J1IAW1_9DIPT|nr:CLUMA_CG009538, isoform A [Clunio marinus]
MSSSTTRHKFIPSATANPKVKKRGSLHSTTDSSKTKKNSHGGNVKNVNATREALNQEGSDQQVVYLSDTSGYIPLNSLRNGPAPVIAPQLYGGADLEAWRPELWDREYNRRYRFNNTRVQHIEAECQDDYMKIRIGFNGSFTGLLYSAGYAYDPDCMYINGSGRDYYEFYIQLNRCGTLGKNSLHDDSHKNPTASFNKTSNNNFLINVKLLCSEKLYVEHVTCEYGYDFWKTVTFPFLDVEVATGNPVVFTLSPPECYMEIRNGYGTAGTRVAGPVRVGDPLTLIIYMRSKYDGFDIVVNDCYAHNGATKRIQLIDEFGCPVDDKLISRFRGSWSDSGIFETQVYAYMKTFRFTGSPALYIECDVRMCHGRCPSQPCHWRNLKGVTKREVKSDPVNSTLSDNISLFQSIRVLQDEDESSLRQESITNQDPTETCLKTSVLSALTATCTMLLCILVGSLFVTCTKLRHRKNENPFFDSAYVGHKGQID